MQIRSGEFNAQQQAGFLRPPASVARAYIDQLSRSKAFQPERARTLTAALKRVDQLRSGRERGASALLDQLDAQAVELEREAGTAEARDALRLRALASTIKGRTASLR